jgi:hypothetical protein
VASKSLLLLQGILEGKFRWDLSFGPPNYEEFLQTKRSLLRSERAAPTFLYTHSGPWHADFTGACREDETERFAARLEASNAEMREDIETLLQNRPDAIVIVNGDHGPYLTKNCTWLAPQFSDYERDDVTRLDIQDRFGSFLAIRWPEHGASDRPDIDILQDVFPAVLAELYPDLDVDALRLPRRIVESERIRIAGASVEDGLIVGGLNDGQPLFLDRP